MIASGEFEPHPERETLDDTYERAEPGDSIPKVMHQIWTHPPLPENFQKFHETVVAQHPSPAWEHRMWSEVQMDAFVAEHFSHYQEAYHAMPALMNRIDVFRFMVLAIEGGVYLDLDYLCTAPIDDLLEDCRVCLSCENDRTDSVNHVANFFLATTPAHPLFFDCVTEILDRPLNELRAYNNPVYDTGPQLFNRVWKAKAAEYRAKVLPRVILSIPSEYYDGDLKPPPLARGYHVCTGTWRS